VAQSLIWTAIAFLAGSIPFAVVIGRLVAGVDVREYGDGNPGATNVLRAMSLPWFILAFLLDYFKGAIPVGLAWFFAGMDGMAIVPVVLAPILGHAYSPWLRFRGGKAVAVTFGSWTGLTLGAGPIVLGLLLALMFNVFVVSGWSLIFAFLAFGGFIWTYYGGAFPAFLLVWAMNLLLFVWKHRGELRQPPGIRPKVLRWIRRSE